MLSALITSTEAAIDAAQEALALTMALAVADLVDLNIFGVSFRLLRFVYDAAILAPYDKQYIFFDKSLCIVPNSLFYPRNAGVNSDEKNKAFKERR